MVFTRCVVCDPPCRGGARQILIRDLERPSLSGLSRATAHARARSLGACRTEARTHRTVCATRRAGRRRLGGGADLRLLGPRAAQPASLSTSPSSCAAPGKKGSAGARVGRTHSSDTLAGSLGSLQTTLAQASWPVALDSGAVSLASCSRLCRSLPGELQ